jgi:glycosyltransferase involved in cell wall biosynthesis
LFQYLSKVYDHTAGYLVTKYSDYQVAISEASGEFSRHLGCKTYIKVYNGIDSHKLVRRSTELRSRLGIPPGDIVITFVGRLIEAKGVQDLIVSFNEVCRQYKAKMLIVGKGNYELPLREQAEGNLDIWFLGEKTEKEIIEYLSITDIFVNPSYSEGLPTSVLEAASCGCAIVATDVGGTREIIHDGKNGILFPPRNLEALTHSIQTLMENKHLRAAYGERARETVESKYDWDVIVSYYVSFLRTIAVSP